MIGLEESLTPPLTRPGTLSGAKLAERPGEPTPFER